MGGRKTAELLIKSLKRKGRKREIGKLHIAKRLKSERELIKYENI